MESTADKEELNVRLIKCSKPILIKVESENEQKVDRNQSNFSIEFKIISIEQTFKSLELLSTRRVMKKIYTNNL